MPEILTRRSLLHGLGAGIGLGLAAPYVKRASAAEPLYVNTWGGSWEESAAAHLFKPFTAETGTEIRTVSPVSFAKLAQQVRTGTYEFDVTTLGGADIVRANQAGIIEKIDTSVVDTGALWKDAVFENGVASHAFATAIAFRKDRYPGGGPQTWAEFFDVAKFPGPRSLQKHAARVIPLAELAEGMPVDKLYPFDLDRAFRALDRVKPQVRVWWTQGQQSQQLLRDGEVSSIGIWHGRVLELQRQNQPVELVWNQAQIDRAYWVVAKGTPRAKQAWQFVQAAVKAERLAKFCQQADYGPCNPKSFEFVPEAAAKDMPTAPANYKLTFEQDVLAVGPQQIADATRRFDQWTAS
jgi:putative spermidine/putrescine transport system substrate-binding protein